MRRITYVLLTLVMIAAACSSVDCPLNNTVYMKMTLDDGSGCLHDTLNITGIRIDGSDTLLVNRLVDAGSVWVPMSYTQECDRLVLSRIDSTGLLSLDTLSVYKSNLPHFESVDCTPTYFHEISSVSSTHHGLDSVLLSKPTVDYDTTRTHIALHFKAFD